MSHKKFITAWDENLTPEIENKAQDELGETPQVREQALEDLKKLIEKERNLNCMLEEKFLLRFLRYSKFNSERAFKTLCNYYRYKLRYKDSFFTYTPLDIKPALDLNCITILPYLTEIGETIFYYRAENVDLDLVKPDKWMAFVIMWMDMLLNFEPKQISGIIFIFDLKGTSYRLFWNYMLYFPAFLYALQDCFPIRFKAAYLLNAPRFCEVCVNAIKACLKEKLRKRTFAFSGNLKRLHENISPEILPPGLQGFLKPLDYKIATKYFMEHQDLIVRINSYGYIN